MAGQRRQSGGGDFFERAQGRWVVQQAVRVHQAAGEFVERVCGEAGLGKVAGFDGFSEQGMEMADTVGEGGLASLIVEARGGVESGHRGGPLTEGSGWAQTGGRMVVVVRRVPLVPAAQACAGSGFAGHLAEGFQ